MELSEINMVCEVDGVEKADQLISEGWTLLCVTGGTKVEKDGAHTAYFRYSLGIDTADDDQLPVWG